MVAWSCLGHNYSDRCPGCCTCLCSLLRGWVSSYFPGLTLTHRHKQSISWPSARLPSKTTLRPWISLPLSEKTNQTKPGKPNQNNSFFLFWKTQEKNLPGLQNVNLRTLWFLVGCHFLPHYALLTQTNTAGPVQGAPPSPKSTQAVTVWKEWLPAKWEFD